MMNIVEKDIHLREDQFKPEEFKMGPDITTVEQNLWKQLEGNFPEKVVIFYYWKGVLVGCQIVRALPYPTDRLSMTD